MRRSKKKRGSSQIFPESQIRKLRLEKYHMISIILVNLRFKRNAAYFASAHDTDSLSVWNCLFEELCYWNSKEMAILSIRQMQDGRLATGGIDLRLWNILSGKFTACKGHSNSIGALCALPGNLLATGSADKYIKIWKVTGDKFIELKILAGHSDYVRCIIHFPFTKEKKIASSSWDHTIKIWNYSLGSCYYTLTGHHGAVEGIFLWNKFLISSSYNCNCCIAIWRIEHGKPTMLKSVKGDKNDNLLTICKLGKNMLVSGDAHGRLKIWNFDTFSLLKSIQACKTGIKSIFKISSHTLLPYSFDKKFKIIILPQNDWLRMNEIDILNESFHLLPQYKYIYIYI